MHYWEYVFINGDINSRPSRLTDFSRIDNFVPDMFEFDNDTASCFDKTNELDNLNIEQSNNLKRPCISF